MLRVQKNWEKRKHKYTKKNTYVNKLIKLINYYIDDQMMVQYYDAIYN